MSEPALHSITARLRAAGCVFAEDEAALLVAAADDAQTLEQLVRRRVAGHPLETLLGWVEFAGLRLQVAPGVFVPRRRTQFLAERALASLPGPDAGGRTLVVELCAGVGAIAAVVAQRRPDVRLHVADVDPLAVRCAAANVPSAEHHVGDLYDALPTSLRGHVDVLVANAPYVPTDAIAGMPPEARDHEPHLALDGGADGVAVHRRLAAGAAAWLRPGGHLLVETGRDQAALTRDAFTAAGLRVRVHTDNDLGATVVHGLQRG